MKKKNTTTQENQQIQQESLKNKDQELELNVIIVGRIYEQDQTFLITKRIVQILKKQMKTSFYFLDQKTKNKIAIQSLDTVPMLFQPEVHMNIIDFVITIGGDGTILYAAKEFVSENSTPPFLVFQKGTLGFLCQFTLQNLEPVLHKAIKYKQLESLRQDKLFKTIKMMRLEAQLTPKYHQTPNMRKLCVNQISITRKCSQKLVLNIYLNKKLLTETLGDGLLISTPTGSTAYALSAGGPIISNGVNCIEIVPIAPYSLSFRPLCVPSSSEISIEISQKSKSSAIISFDGQTSEKLERFDWITIKKSSSEIVFFSPLDEQQTDLPEWMERLQLFLHWNEGYKASQCQREQNTLKKIFNRTHSLYDNLQLLPKNSKFQNDQKEKEYKSSIDECES